MRTRRILLLLVLTVLGTKQLIGWQKSVSNVTSTPVSIEATIEKYGKAFLENEIISSISIGIYKDGQTYSGHYGELDRKRGNQPTDSTLYSIASVTKTMTGTLVAKAVLDKKFSLEDDIRLYLDGNYPNLSYQNSPIRVKHLLTHTSGLPTDPAGYDRMLEQFDFTLPYSKEVFFVDLKEVKIDTLPGTTYRYSNLGTILMSYLLEHCYKRSFEEMLQEVIFEKAEMTQTRLSLNETEVEKLEKGYDQNGKTAIHIPLHLTGAEGMVKSTITDLMKYMTFQLDKENPLVAESHKTVDQDRWMGYYWQISNDGESVSYQHPGFSSGTINWFFVYPKYNMGISVITNVRGPNVTNLLYYDLAAKLLDAIRPSGKSVGMAVKAKNFQSAKEVIAYYHQLKKNETTQYNFMNSAALNKLGYAYLKANKVKEAIKLFKLNTKEHPQDANTFDSLGEAYFQNKTYKLALKNYQKSLLLNPKNEQAKKKILEIEKYLK